MPQRLNALFIGNSYMNRQERIVPALLRQAGYEFEVRSLYAPGQTFEGHLQNNAGVVTESQREGIERGRIGGWFPDAHCATLYRIYEEKRGSLDRVLAELRYDVAFVLVSGGDSEEPDKHRSLEHGGELIHRIRAAHPGIRIVLLSPWTYLGRPEMLPLFIWVAQRLALEHGCSLAPAGTAFRMSEERQPGLFLRRSPKDSHQNDVSILLAAYTQVCALLGEAAATTDFSANRADLRGIEDTATALDPAVDTVFQAIAREATAQAAVQLATLSLAALPRPEIVKPPTTTTALNADRRLLVIGNAWLDGNGAAWTELISSYQARDALALHIETVTDDGATFASIIANNRGDLTPRQRRILETVGRMQGSMGTSALDADALDGLGDYPIAMALAQLSSRKGRLDAALAMPVSWDAVLIQGFRFDDPGEAEAIAAGRELIALVRGRIGSAPLFLCEHWAKRGSEPAEQQRIRAAYQRLGEACQVPVIPIGSAIAATRNVELLAGDYAPNSLGVQLISETLRRHLRLESNRTD